MNITKLLYILTHKRLKVGRYFRFGHDSCGVGRIQILDMIFPVRFRWRSILLCPGGLGEFAEPGGYDAATPIGVTVPVAHVTQGGAGAGHTSL